MASLSGIAFTALGMISILPLTLSIDTFYAIVSNSKRIAEMTGENIHTLENINNLYIAGKEST